MAQADRKNVRELDIYARFFVLARSGNFDDSQAIVDYYRVENEPHGDLDTAFVRRTLNALCRIARAKKPSSPPAKL
jgi:hypothetical protein